MTFFMSNASKSALQSVHQDLMRGTVWLHISTDRAHFQHAADCKNNSLNKQCRLIFSLQPLFQEASRNNSLYILKQPRIKQATAL